jgi:phosphoribosyl-AMP cyclohydrolase
MTPAGGSEATGGSTPAGRSEATGGSTPSGGSEATGGSALDAGIASRLKRDANGLITAVALERGTGKVLMVAWMDDIALARTLETRQATYYSRSRGRHWRKGETSGHTQHVHSVRLDCDGDTVLLEVDQVGAACHTGDHSCFDADVLLAPEP